LKGCGEWCRASPWTHGTPAIPVIFILIVPAAVATVAAVIIARDAHGLVAGLKLAIVQSVPPVVLVRERLLVLAGIELGLPVAGSPESR
jgi:hypothetical protein